MRAESDLEKLQRMLRHISAAYEAIKPKRFRTNSDKRKAISQTLSAIADYLQAQPAWCKADTALLDKQVHGLINTENGHKISWMVGEGGHRLKEDLITVTIGRAKAAAKMQRYMDQHRHTGGERISRKKAAQMVCADIPAGSSLFKGTTRRWQTVAWWRDDIRYSPRESLGRMVYEDELKK